MRTKCQDTSNPYRNDEKTEINCVPKTGCAKEDETRGRRKKLLKQRNISICNNSRKQHGNSCNPRVPGTTWSPPRSTTALPRSCWAASLPGSMCSQHSKPWDTTRNGTGRTQNTQGPQGVPRTCHGGHTKPSHLSPLEGGNISSTWPRKAPNFISVMKGWGCTYNLGEVRVSCTREFDVANRHFSSVLMLWLIHCTAGVDP